MEYKADKSKAEQEYIELTTSKEYIDRYHEDILSELKTEHNEIQVGYSGEEHVDETDNMSLVDQILELQAEITRLREQVLRQAEELKKKDEIREQLIDYINSMNVDDEFSNYNAYSKLFDFIEKIFEEETNF